MDLGQIRRQPAVVGTRHIIGTGSGAIDITNAVRMDRVSSPPLERLSRGTLLLMHNHNGDEVLAMKAGDGDGIIPMGRVKDLKDASLPERIRVSMEYDMLRDVDPEAIMITAKTPEDLRKGVAHSKQRKTHQNPKDIVDLIRASDDTLTQRQMRLLDLARVRQGTDSEVARRLASPWSDRGEYSGAITDLRVLHIRGFLKQDENGGLAATPKGIHELDLYGRSMGIY